MSRYSGPEYQVEEAVALGVIIICAIIVFLVLIGAVCAGLLGTLQHA